MQATNDGPSGSGALLALACATWRTAWQQTHILAQCMVMANVCSPPYVAKVEEMQHAALLWYVWEYHTGGQAWIAKAGWCVCGA